MEFFLLQSLQVPPAVPGLQHLVRGGRGRGGERLLIHLQCLLQFRHWHHPRRLRFRHARPGQVHEPGGGESECVRPQQTPPPQHHSGPGHGLQDQRPPGGHRRGGKVDAAPRTSAGAVEHDRVRNGPAGRPQSAEVFCWGSSTLRRLQGFLGRAVPGRGHRPLRGAISGEQRSQLPILLRLQEGGVRERARHLSIRPLRSRLRPQEPQELVVRFGSQVRRLCHGLLMGKHGLCTIYTYLFAICLDNARLICLVDFSEDLKFIIV
ncbi:hypothetical protein CEXT_772171 [Caerostris extrusa]|uniref:Uncharacterized protein n=1 Tax=Caerostris extrusa TaxID=172846 RepID=A0AAV4VH95_CAEEX|nr:hypothetical protein CEXT_772171 [Caerostris extrusa]